jgi:iron complex outermembrane receptor protein
MAVAASTLFLGGNTAQSQTNLDQQRARDANVPIEDVVVTAQKRGIAENEQSVPISLTAINSVELEHRHVVDLQDLTTVAPNVTLHSAGTGGIANFTIRGLGINSTIPSVEPAVGVFENGIYLGITAGVVLDNLFDVEDVEVLRGPQGLLFGRNTTGGAVLINTYRPGDTFRARARFDYATGPEVSGAVSLGGPVAAHVKVGLSYSTIHDDGWFTNTFDGRKIGASHTSDFRPTIVWTPTASFDTTLILEAGSRHGDGPVDQNPAFFGGFTVNIDNRGYDDQDWVSGTLESNWRMDGVITNLFGYRQFDQAASADIDATPRALFNGYDALNQHQVSDELRYSGQSLGRFDVTAGLYFFTQTFSYFERRVLAFGRIDSTLGGHLLDTNYAAFANIDYAITPDLTLTAGGRFSREQKSVRIATFVPSTKGSLCNFTAQACSYNFPGPAFPNVPGSDAWNSFIPKLGFYETLDTDVFVYGNWTRGIRSGGYNVRNVSFTIAPGPYGPESQDAFEAGVKSDWLGRHLRVNADVFYNTIRDLQRDVNFTDPVVGVVQVTKNTADATIKGFEIETTGALTDEFVLNGNAGYTEGVYDKLFNPIGTGGAADLALRIPELSKWSYSVGASYRHVVAGFLVQLRSDYGYRSRAAYTDNNLAFLSPVENLSASASIGMPEQHWALSIYGRNLLNSVWDGENVPLPASLGGGSDRTLNEGRVIGLQASFTY